MKITRACNKEQQKNVPACITCMSTTDSILFTLAERSMAHVMLHFIQHRRALRRERLLRDRLNPLEKYDDVEIKALFRFERQHFTDHQRFTISHRTYNRPQQSIIALASSLRLCTCCFSAVLYGKMICKML